MSSKIRKDSLASEVSAIDVLLASLDEDDFIGRQSLEYKRDEIASELQSLERQVGTAGRVILAFEGGPVSGSRGIDANFAAKTIDDYQDLIAKQVAAQEVQLARTGPVPARGLARLNITNVVHGSFGFELEESGESQLSLVDSPVRTAIVAVDNVLSAFASGNDEVFQTALASVDRRVFLSIQSFYENMYRDSAALKIIEDDRDFVINQHDVVVARSRISGVEVVDTDLELTGELLGMTPISRRFDLRVISSDVLDVGRIVSGQVGQRLSNDYLERLHGSSRIAGQRYRAEMTRRLARRIDGTTSESFTLVDLDLTSSDPQIGLQ